MTLDTNILIAFFEEDPVVVGALSAWKMQGISLFLSTIVEAEVLSFDKWTSGERNRIEQFLEQEFVSVPFDRPLSRIAARIRVKKSIKLPDAAIAATALYTNSPLVTRNIRDFRSVQNLQVLSL